MRNTKVAYKMGIDFELVFTSPDEHGIAIRSEAFCQRCKRKRFENGSFARAIRTDQDIDLRRKLANERIRMITEISEMNGFGSHNYPFNRTGMTSMSRSSSLVLAGSMIAARVGVENLIEISSVSKCARASSIKRPLKPIVRSSFE